MIQTISPIVEKKVLSDEIHLLTFRSKELVQNAQPGQFLNIRVSNAFYPYLRRPFSICEVNNDTFSILFSIFGMGTKTLANAKVGDEFDIIGPLGKGFTIPPKLDYAVIVAGGLGAAPFPFLMSKFQDGTKIKSFIGARTKELIVTYKLNNALIATDDGSFGKKMTVVKLLEEELNDLNNYSNLKIYGCGPTPMLKALTQLCLSNNLDCEISTECAMACGFGICQGCPIESSNSDEYYLVCKDGPVFNIKDIKI